MKYILATLVAAFAFLACAGDANARCRPRPAVVVVNNIVKPAVAQPAVQINNIVR